MNWFKQLFSRSARQQRREVKQRVALAKMMATMDELEQKQLLWVDIQNRRLLISDEVVGPLAQNDKAWQGLFNNLGTWLHFRLYQDYWTRRCIDAEAEAVREARRQNRHLTMDEMRRLQAQADFSVLEPDGGRPQIEFEAYEFCICSGPLRIGAEATAVGVWKDGQVEINLVTSK